MKLTLQNFRTHAFLEVEFKEIVEITGTNGKGKTSILEAIVFGLFGKDFYGKTGTDRYIKEGTNDATVMLNMDDGNEIKRILTVKGQEIYFNGAKISQGELELKYGNILNVLPVINPFYFMGMSDEAKRELFMKLLPQADRKKIFIEKYGDKLVDRFLIMSEDKAKSQLKSATDTYTQNQIMVGQYTEQKKTDLQEVEMLKKQLKPVDNDLVASANKRKVVAETIDTIQRNLQTYGNLEGNRETAEKLLAVIVEKAKKLLSQYGGESLKEAIEQHLDLFKKLTNKENELASKIYMAEQDKKKFEQLRDSGKCPTCLQDVQGGTVEDRLAEIEKTIVTDKELREKVVKQQTLEEQIYKELSGLQEEGKKVQSDLTFINGNWDNYLKLQKDLQTNKEALKELEGVVFDPSIVSNKEISAKIEVIESRIATADKTIVRLQDQNRVLEPEIEDMKVIVDAYGAKGVESEIIKQQTVSLVGMLKKYIPDISVETMKSNKTNDGYKEVFDIFMDGIEFRSLSLGERIIVAMAFGLVTRELQEGTKVPFVLLDEASTLGKGFTSKIEEWCKRAKVSLIYTRISSGNFAVKSRKYDK